LACPRSPEFATTAGGDGSLAGRRNQVTGAGTVEEEDGSSPLYPLSTDKIRLAWVGPACQLTSVDKREASCATSSLETRMSETLLIGQKSTISGHCEQLARNLCFLNLKRKVVIFRNFASNVAVLR
jgi:hypothetical protein